MTSYPVAGAARVDAGTPEPEAVNPVHRRWRPAPDGDDFVGPANRLFVLDRVGDRYVVNANADVPDAVRGDHGRVAEVDTEAYDAPVGG